MHISTQGLVLREVNYKESDKLLTVLTAEGGKRTVKARGCRRKGSPLAAAAQLLVYSDMTLFEYRDYFTLNEAESLQQFWRVRSDLERLSLASYFAEVMEAVALHLRRGDLPPRWSLLRVRAARGLGDMKLPDDPHAHVLAHLAGELVQQQVGRADGVVIAQQILVGGIAEQGGIVDKHAAP